MAIDSSGYAHVTWEEEVDEGVQRIWYANNRGGVWSAPVVISDPEVTDNYDPRIAVDRNGYAHVTWESWVDCPPPIYYANNTTGDWSDNRTVVSEDVQAEEIVYGNEDPDIAVDAQGYAHITWRGVPEEEQEDALGKHIYYADNTDGSWHPEIISSDNNKPQKPRIAVDADGHSHVAWDGFGAGDDYRQVFYSSNDALDNSWQEPEKVSDDSIEAGNRYPLIALGPSGVAHIAWWNCGFYDYDTGECIFPPGIYYANNSGAWADNRALVSDGLYGNNDPDLAVDAQGIAYIAWSGVPEEEAELGMGKHIYYADNAGADWLANRAMVSGGLFNNAYPMIAADTQGKSFISWDCKEVDSEEAKRQVYYTDNTAGWGPNLTRISAGSSDVGSRYPEIGLGPDGMAQIAWWGGYQTTDNEQIYYRRALVPPSVQTGMAVAGDDSRATLNGNITATGGENASERGFRYREQGAAPWNNWTEKGLFGPLPFSYDLTGLEPGTDYEYQAMAKNGAGWGYGEIKTFNTGSQLSTWYLAEGTNAWGFSTYITIQNVNNEPVTAKLTYMDPNPGSGAGLVGTQDVTLPPFSQTTVSSAEKIGNVDFSTKVECPQDRQIAVDRTMFWTGEGATSPEAHSSIGTTTPSGSWYLPEGSSNWGFETWTLVQNPNGAEAKVRLTYMVEGRETRSFDRTVPANSRATYSMASDMGAADASIRVDSDIPVIAERSMYRDNRREGHCSIGATTPAPDYYLAEGAVGYGAGFTTWVLVQNPNNDTNKVTVTYLTGSGEVPGPTIDMPANSRKTIRVNDALSPATDVSTKVHGEKPVIAERAMYWNSSAGEACHDSIGMDSAHRSFYLPDGQTSEGRETWTLVANPNGIPVEVRISYLPEGGGTPVSFTDIIGPNSRKSYNMVDKIASGRASIMVESIMGGPVMCERAMYWNDRAAGTDTIGGYSD